MLASGISGLLMGNSTQGVPAKMVAFTQVFWASGIFQMVKVTEIVAGFMLVISQRPIDALILMAWCDCLCADRLFGVRLLGQVQINLLPQLIERNQTIGTSYFALSSRVASASPVMPGNCGTISTRGKSAILKRSQKVPNPGQSRSQLLHSRPHGRNRVGSSAGNTGNELLVGIVLYG